jgi:serine/threonine-protein kinase
MSAFAAELKAVAREMGKAASIAPAQPLLVRGGPAGEQLLRRILKRVDPAGPLFATGLSLAPTASVKLGAAGIGYALYRLAVIRDDPELLGAADLWSMKALAEAQDKDAFYNEALEVTPATVGTTSPYHTLSGLYVVQALISQARGDFSSAQAAVDGFIAASAKPNDNLDLTLGQAGTLLACAMLWEPIRVLPHVDGDELCRLGDERMATICGTLGGAGPIREATWLPNLGMAHGWAGLLYATMRWCLTSGRPLPAAVGERLTELAVLAEPIGRGARWPWELNPPGSRRTHIYMPGWCNGSAGYVYLWTLAYEMLAEPPYLALAEQAAWHAFEEPSGIGNICCGYAGRAYSLLNLYKVTDDPRWLTRARQLAERAATMPDPEEQKPNSIYKSDLGAALLAADLTRPDRACQPFFEREGWPVTVASRRQQTAH